MGLLDFFTGDQPPLVKQSLNDVRFMLDTGRDMFAAASAHVLDNEILDIDFYGHYTALTVREQSVRRSVLEHLNVDPRRELVLCLKLFIVVSECRQIGGHALMMGDASRLARGPRLGLLVDQLRAIRQRTQALFDLARDAFLDGDLDKANRVRAQRQSIEVELDDVLAELASKDRTTNQVVVVTLSAYALRHATGHLYNIAGVIVSPFE